MKKFTTESMYEIILYLEKLLKDEKRVSFEVLNPDLFSSTYSGTKVKTLNNEYIYRAYKAWNDLAQKLFCRVLTPKIASKDTVVITFESLNKNNSFHNEEDDMEKYGIASSFSQINKNEEPETLLTYLQALKNVNINKRKRVLNLGVNKAEEFEIIKQYSKEFENIEFIGVDYCKSAIKEAKNKFKNNKNVSFYTEDINNLDSLDLGEFDLIISIGTLQSSNLEFNKVFMHIVQNYLKKDGSMILGFPNSRWIDGEIVYGAKVPNYTFSEMSLLFKDAIFCKKYLQQKKFRVTLTGKYYVFLTATSIRKN